MQLISEPYSARARRQPNRVSLLRKMITLGLCGALLMTGCARVDHMHDPADLKAAEEAEKKLSEFSSSRDGLTATLLNNLKARREFEAQVAELRGRVFDGELSGLSTDITWLRLRAKLLHDLGVLRFYQVQVAGTQRFFDPDDMTVSLDQVKQAVDYGNENLKFQITVRQLQVAAALAALEVVAAAQVELQSQTSEQVEKAKRQEAYWRQLSTQPATTKPYSEFMAESDAEDDEDKPTDSETQLRQKRAEYALEILRVINAAAERSRETQGLREQATALQQALFEQIAASRDPASATSLVAVVGTGLDDDSAALLRSYVDQLKISVDQIKTLKRPFIPTDKDADSVGDTTGLSNLLGSITRFEQTVEQAKEANAYDFLQSASASAREGNNATRTPTMTAQFRAASVLLEPSFLAARKREASIVGPEWPREAAMSESARVDRNFRLSIVNSLALTATGSLGTSESQFGELRQAFTGLIARAAGEKKKRPPGVSRRQAKKDANINAGQQLTAAVVGGSPLAAAAIEKKVKAATQPGGTQEEKNLEEALNQLGTVVQDIHRYEVEARLRVSQFVRDLFSLQSIVAGENARHALAIVAIAELEARRWRRLEELNVDYSSAFSDDNLEPQVDADLGWMAPVSAVTRICDRYYEIADQQRKVASAHDLERVASRRATSIILRYDAVTGADRQGKRIERAISDLKAEMAANDAVIDSAKAPSLSKALATRDELKAKIEELTKKLDATYSDASAAAEKARTERLQQIDAMLNLKQPFTKEVLEEVAQEKRAIESDSQSISFANTARLKVETERRLLTVTVRYTPPDQKPTSEQVLLVDEARRRVVDRKAVADAAVGKLRELQARFEGLRLTPTPATRPAVATAPSGAPAPAMDRAREDELRKPGAFGDGTTARLFRSDKSIERYYSDADRFPVPPPAAGQQPMDRVDVAKVRHPSVTVLDNTLLTLRRLGAAGRASRAAGEIFDPASPWRVAAANARLTKAIGLIQGHLLMLSYNRHEADMNAIRLRAALIEHEIQLDDAYSKARESGFRLTLGDIKAYHATGITEADIEALLFALLGGLSFR